MRLKDNSKITKTGILILLIITGIISCIRPVYPDEQYLQHLGTILLLLVLVLDIKKERLSLLAYVFFSGFILLHIIGARYIYSYVPYTKWLNAVVHLVSDHTVFMQHGRNGYDRVVHFAYGILVFPIVYEYLNRRKNTDRLLVILAAWAMIQAMSMLYEIFEWVLTLVLSPGAANDYNGQQGDLWDPQKDMLLAMAGSTFMAGLYLIIQKRKPV